MSARFPIVAVTGSSGAGTPVVTRAIEHLLYQQRAHFTIVDGDGFHRYDRVEFPRQVARAAAAGRAISHFSPETNLLDMLESLLREFADQGRGMHRRYIHDPEAAERWTAREGTFTPWEPIPPDTEMLIYEGLHGCFVSDTVDVARYADLRLGVVPIVNLEWIQKIHRDTRQRGYSVEAVMDTVERRLPDYVRYITPQFSRTDINFQRIPMVDTANPFEPQDLPSLAESRIVVHFRQVRELPYTLPHLLERLPGSFMSRQRNLVVHGSDFELALQLVLEPFLERLLSRSRMGRAAAD
jgi:phosphoribulokinase